MTLQEISDKNPERANFCKIATKSLRLAELFEELENTDAIIELRKILKLYIDDINDKLINEYELSEVERKVIIKQKECWEWLDELFISQKNNIKKINNFIKEYE